MVFAAIWFGPLPIAPPKVWPPRLYPNLIRMATQSSSLRFGPPAPSYGAFPSNSNGQGRSPPPYASHSAAPGPTSVRPLGLPHPPGELSRGRASLGISRGLAICFVVMLLQAVLIIRRSDTLARYIDLESEALHVSREKFALAVERERSEREREESEQEREKWERERGKSLRERAESRRERGEFEQERSELRQERNQSQQEREKSQQERESMRRDRELWERALEDRVPQGAFWEVVWPTWECRAYGKRDYWGMLQNIPEGWSTIDACMNMPVEIGGVTVRRPYRCAFVDGSPLIHGYWLVDWDQTDCKPWYRNYQDAVGAGYPSLLRVGTHTNPPTHRDVRVTSLVPAESRGRLWA